MVTSFQKMGVPFKVDEIKQLRALESINIQKHEAVARMQAKQANDPDADVSAEAKTLALVRYVQRFQRRSVQSLMVEFMTDSTNRKTLIHLILTLNASFPDYDFSSLRPEDLKRRSLWTKWVPRSTAT